MLFIPVQNLQEGMVLAQDIHFEISTFSLLTKGQSLRDIHIRKLHEMNIIGVYIESSISEDIEINCIIDEKIKSETLITVKRTFEDLAKGNRLSTASVRHIMDIAEKLVLSILANDEILINLIDLKGYDDYTYQHSLCVSIIAIIVGIRLGFNLEKLNLLAISGLLHDLGKMTVPKEILNKRGKLTEEEFEIMKKHPMGGVKYLEKLNMLSEITLKGIESHHEKFDGTGYPKKLVGEQIPLFGRILAVADVYDALTSDRPYRKASFPNEVIEYMMANADVHFDQEILEAFLKSVAAYPVGMLVRLSSGQTALVVKNNEENTLRPVVRIVGADGVEGADIDLQYDAQYHSLTITGTGYGDDDIDYALLSSQLVEEND